MSSSKKNTKGTKSTSNGNSNSGSENKKTRNSSSSPPQQQRQDQQQQTPPAGTATPKQPNAWSKPLQTKSSTTGNNNQKPGPTSSNSNNKASSTATNANQSSATLPPPGYKARDSNTASTKPQAQQLPSSSASNPNRNASLSPKGEGAATLAPISNSNSMTEEALKNRDRSLQMFLVLLGHKVVCHLTSGIALEGILRTATPFAAEQHSFVYLLKRTRVVAGEHSNIKPGTTVTIPMDQVVQLHVPQVKVSTLMQSKHGGVSGGTSSSNSSSVNGFTDAEISAARGTNHSNDRSLQAAGSAWTSAVSGPAASSGGLAGRFNRRAEALQGVSNSGSSAAGPLQGSIGAWDQFQANEKLFNVHASYDETVYTTPLDKSQLDASKIKRAEQLAKEIEASPSGNVHMQQERNQKLQGDFDEEDLHSGVARDIVPMKNSDSKNSGKAADKKEIVNKHAETKKDQSTTGGGSEVPMNYAKAVQKKQDEVDKAAKHGDTKEAKVPKVNLETLISEESKEEELTMTAEPAVAEKTAVEPPPKEEEKEADQSTTAPLADENLSSENKSTQDEVSVDDTAAAMESTEDNKSQTSDKPKTRSKLNANAKEFTLNINAKSFTPSYSSPPPQEIQQHQHQQHHHHLQQQHQHHLQHHQPYDMMVPPPQYMPSNSHLGQHGMMPMMGPQFGAIRYASGPYGTGMEQQMPPHQMAQPQHAQNQQQGSAPQMVGSPPSVPIPPPPPPPPQHHQYHPPPVGAVPATGASPVLDVPPDQDCGVRTTDSDSQPPVPMNAQPQQHRSQAGPDQPPPPRQPGQDQSQPHQQPQMHPPHMQPVHHPMHPQGAYYGTLVPARGPVPYNQPQYMTAPPPMYRPPQMYAPMAPPKVMTARPPYYGAPNTAPMAPVPYGGYGGYGGAGEEGMVDGYGRGGGRHGGRGRGGRHGQGRGGRHHTGRGGRSNSAGGSGGGNNNLGSGRGGRGYIGTGGNSSGRNTPEDGSAAVVSPEPPNKNDIPTTEGVSST
ncbi:hypothetical protein ACA910_002985 [Epithemia clementina (nom. ined.)]